MELKSKINKGPVCGLEILDEWRVRAHSLSSSTGIRGTGAVMLVHFPAFIDSRIAMDVNYVEEIRLED